MNETLTVQRPETSAPPSPKNRFTIKVSASRVGHWMRERRAALRAYTDSSSVAYLLVFSAAAAVLLASARNGASELVVQTVLLGFAVVATLWVREQYVNSFDSEHWVLPVYVALGMLLGFAVLAGVWFATRIDGLGLASLYVLWLAGSALVSRMRDPGAHGDGGYLQSRFVRIATHQVDLGIRLTAAGLLCLIAGLLWIGDGPEVLLWLAAAAVLGALLALPLGLRLISAGLLCLIAGLLLIGHESAVHLWLAAAAFLGALLALPVGISLLSEAAILKLQRPEYKQVRPVVVGLGAVLFLMCAALAVVVAHTAWVLVIFVALLAIMIATASSTHADVAIVMAAVALLGVTPHPQSLSDRMAQYAPPGQTLDTLVAIGDSYMSGEGASIYYKGTDEGDGNQCRRAPSAWAALASDTGFNALEFLACSGARTGNVLYDPNAKNPELAIPSQAGAQRFRDELIQKHLIQTQNGDAATQLDQWRADKAARGLKATLVVVSLGGNDAGFSTIGAMCLAPGSCDERKDLWLDSLDQVRSQLRLAYAEIAETFPDVPVVTVGYPDPILLERRPCKQVWLTPNERTFIHKFLTGDGKKDGLNDVVQKTSDEFGFYYVDTIETALAGAHLQLCDRRNDGRPGLNFVGLRSVRGAAEQRFNPANWIHSSLHPNERGHAALLRAFRTWLAQQPQPLPARAPIRPASAKDLQTALETWSNDAPKQAQKAVNKAGPCDLFETSADGCRTQGSDWALGQVRHMLLFGGGLWLCLFAAAGALAVAVGFFADKRARRQARRRTKLG